MQRLPRFRVDPDVEISRVLNQLADYYNERKFEENNEERAKRLPIYERRHAHLRHLWTGIKMSEEEQLSLRKELAGQIREEKSE